MVKYLNLYPYGWQKDSEAKLLNEINQSNRYQPYGEESFIGGKDFIIHLEDAQALDMFLEFCFKRLQSGFTLESNGKCGFMRFGSDVVISYIIKDDKKYVPLFYFNREFDNLRHDTLKLENWDFAYLKFCLKVQNIKDEFFPRDSCYVISFDTVKRIYPLNTEFEEYWPEMDDYRQRLINQTSRINPSDFWVKKPSVLLNRMLVHKNIVLCPDLCPSQSAIPPPSIPIVMSSNQSGLPSNQKSLVGLQQNTSSNPMNIQSSCFVQMNNPTTQIVSGRRSVSNSQPQQKLLENQKRPQQMLQQKLHQKQQRCQKEEKQQQEQKKLQVEQQMSQQKMLQQPQWDGGQPMMNKGVVCSNSGITNTQQRYILKPVVIDQTSEIIDLTSPPSSPGLSPVQSPYSISSAGALLDLTRISENEVFDPFFPAYQIQKVPLLGKMIQCINAEAFGKLPMVTLDDLVQTMFPSSTVASCADVLTNDLNLTLYRGNSEQITMLRLAGLIRSNNTDETPMALLKDIIPVIPKLKDLLRKHNEQMLYLSREDEPVKRQHTSYK